MLNTTKYIVDADIIEGRVPRTENGLYCFGKEFAKSSLAKKIESLELWHKRLIHSNAKFVEKSYSLLHNAGVLKNDMKKCHPFELGKAHKQHFNSSFEDASEPGEIVHSDFAGQLPVSCHESKYFGTFVDQYSLFMNLASPECKSDAKEAYEA